MAEDWVDAAKTFKRRLLHGGRDARKKFLRVPEDVQDADKLYSMIVTTGDAASQWALAVVRDPPTRSMSRRSPPSPRS